MIALSEATNSLLQTRDFPLSLSLFYFVSFSPPYPTYRSIFHLRLQKRWTPPLTPSDHIYLVSKWSPVTPEGHLEN